MVLEECAWQTPGMARPEQHWQDLHLDLRPAAGAGKHKVR